MSFRPILDQLLAEIPAALGAIIVDWEGEAVDQAARIGEYDLKILGAHSGIILNLLRETLVRTGGGFPEEVCIRTQHGRTLICPVTEDYLLIVQLGTEALMPWAAYRMRACAEQLHGDISI